MNDTHELALSVLAKLSPNIARREIAWLVYKIEMDFQQDIHDRIEVYRQAVADALPTLPPDHAEILALVWEDCEERIALKWDKQEPPNPERDADIRSRIAALNQPGLQDWYKALRAPFDDIDDPDWQRIYDLLETFSPKPASVWADVVEDIGRLLTEGRYDVLFQQRSEGRWPDIKHRRPAAILNLQEADNE